MSNQSKSAVACPACGGVMHLARVLPKLGAFPELHTFKCQSCGEVDTRDATVAVSGRAELGTEAPQ